MVVVLPSDILVSVVWQFSHGKLFAHGTLLKALKFACHQSIKRRQNE